MTSLCNQVLCLAAVINYIYAIPSESERTAIYCREHVYSFSEAIVDFSTGLDVLVLGLTIVSKPDDLNAYFQVIEAFLAVFTFLGN